VHQPPSLVDWRDHGLAKLDESVKYSVAHTVRSRHPASSGGSIYNGVWLEQKEDRMRILPAATRHCHVDVPDPLPSAIP